MERKRKKQTYERIEKENDEMEADHRSSRWTDSTVELLSLLLQLHLVGHARLHSMALCEVASVRRRS